MASPLPAAAVKDGHEVPGRFLLADVGCGRIRCGPAGRARSSGWIRATPGCAAVQRRGQRALPAGHPECRRVRMARTERPALRMSRSRPRTDLRLPVVDISETRPSNSGWVLSSRSFFRTCRGRANTTRSHARLGIISTKVAGWPNRVTWTTTLAFGSGRVENRGATVSGRRMRCWRGTWCNRTLRC